METRAHHVWIGLFVVAAVICGALFSLWLNQSTRDQSYTQYEVLFHQGVSGLSEGNSVEYSGVRVGDVVSLRLDPEDPRNVVALIRVLSHIPVRQDTRARLALANITGSMSVQLHGGSPETPLLITDTDPPPRILADQSPLGALLSDSGELISNVNAVLSRMEELLSEDNVASVEQILSNLERTTAQFARLGDAPSRVAAGMEEISREAALALAELRSLSQHAEGIMHDHAEGLMLDARQVTASLARTAQGLETMLEENTGALESGLRGIQGLGPATVELRGTLSTLTRVLRRLEENPRAFLLGRDQIEEFAP